MPVNIKKIKKATEKIEGSNKFLAEEILVPMVNHCDGMRITMFDNNLPQLKVLATPDFPNVFTNFENQVGKYSTAYKVAEDDLEIIAKIPKNQMNTLFLFKDKNNNITCQFVKYAERITERYGYLYNNYITKKKVGDKIHAGECLYASTSYDQNLNFCYGKNLKACFLAYNNQTYEDSIVISDVATKKLESYSPDEIVITINTNDILLNLRGNSRIYKCFPDIGENSNSTILCARRRINYDSILFDLNNDNIKKINYDTDTIFFLNSDNTVVYDIDVFCNSDISKLEINSAYKQILKYYHKNLEYYKSAIAEIEKYLNDENYVCSEEVKYIYRRYSDLINENTQYKYDGNAFDNIVLRIKTIAKKHIVIGSKLTGRYGSKGVVSVILPQNKMPMNEYGEYADVCLNPTGVFGRLNLAQLIEQELNFTADNILRTTKKMKFNDDKFEYIMGFYHLANPKQEEFLRNKWSNYTEEEKENFMNECYEHGLYIHEPPFFGNTPFENIIEINEKYHFDYYHCTVDGKKIETPLCIGNIYYLQLKHDPSSKFSARSSGDLSINNTPSKSNSFKYHTSIFSRTPVRCGEMEFTSLLLTNNIKLVGRFLAQTSTNPEERKNFNKALLTGDPFNMEKINLIGAKSITSQIVKIQLLTLSLENTDNTLEDSINQVTDVIKYS